MFNNIVSSIGMTALEDEEDEEEGSEVCSGSFCIPQLIQTSTYPYVNSAP